jgi:hypothetical protein
MPAAVVGSLRVLLSADSAQIISDLGKARAAVKETGAEIKGMGSAGTALRAVTAEIKGVGPALRGVQQATQITMQGFLLMGTKVPTQISGISNALASLVAGGFTPAGLAIAAVTAGIGLFAAAQADAQAKSEKLSAALQAQKDRYEELRKAAERAELQARATASGRDVDLVGVEEQIADALGRKERGARRLADLPPYAHTHGVMQEEIRREIAAAESDLRRLAIERSLVERRIRATTPPRETTFDPERERQRTEEILRLLREARGEKDPTPAASTQAQSPSGPPVSPAVAALRAEVEQLRRGIEERKEALKVLRGWGTETEVALQTSLENFEKARQGGAEVEETAALAARVKSLREILDLERQEAEVRRSLDEKDAAERAASERADDLRKADEQRAKQAADLAARIREVESDLAFDLAQADRTETERRLAEAARRYEGLLEQARAYGVSTVEIERLLGEQQARIREQATAEDERAAERRRAEETAAAVAPDTLGAGFTSRIEELRAETASWGQLGAQMADLAANGLSGGVAQALEDIARGSRSATEAFREFAADFAFQVARMIEQALIMKAIMALFSGLGGAGGAAGAAGGEVAAQAVPAATGAHGGTWRVGGFGGLDSQLVSMKLSPGELVRVSNGANSGGDGDVHVALTVRPPAVIADEVMARSSPDARAAIVASALRRSGRRGMRPRD